MPRRPSRRQYPRTARVNHLIQEIVADALARVDDERLTLVAITGVEVDRGLERAVVYFDDPDADQDDEVLTALGRLAPRLRETINAEARLRRVPALEFRPDPGVRAGDRIDQILRGLGAEEDHADPDG